MTDLQKTGRKYLPSVREITNEVCNDDRRKLNQFFGEDNLSEHSQVGFTRRSSAASEWSLLKIKFWA